MKFKLGAEIPVGTIVYKMVRESRRRGRRVLTCIVTRPGFCPLVKEGVGKCRVAEVLVIGCSNKKETVWESDYDPNFKYKLYNKKGTKFNTDKYEVCTEGIHVFLSKRAAERY